MNLSVLLKIEVSGKVVKIYIDDKVTERKDLILINSFIERHLDLLKMEEVVKWYSNRVDFFTVMPQQDWHPDELALELKGLLEI